MALTATKVFPAAPEICPVGGGLLMEIWQVTGDGSDLTVDITTESIRRIKAATGGNMTANITASTTNSITLTYYLATAFVPNGLTQFVIIFGKA